MDVLSPLRAALSERGKALRGGLLASAAPQRPDLSWRSVALQAGGMWLASRVAYALLTYFGLLIGQGGRATTRTYVPPSALLAAWSHWDANWYISIGLNGYTDAERTGFLPLYPFLIHVATLVMGRANALAAAMVVSNLGTLGAFIALGLLAASEEARVDAAWRAIRAFAAYPLAVFLVAAYTEGLFVALAASALLCARRGSWRWAAGWALLAALTRPTGLALAPALLWEYGRQHEWWARTTWQGGGWRRALRPKTVAEAVAVVGAAPLSLIAFAAYNWLRFGDPIMFIRAQRIYWQHERLPLWETLGRAISQLAHAPAWTDAQAYLLMNFVPLLIFMALALVGIRKLPFAFTLFTFGVLYLSLASPVNSPQLDILTSVGRYMMCAIPIFLLLGRWVKDRPWLDMLVVSGGFLLQAIFALAFLRNGYVL